MVERVRLADIEPGRMRLQTYPDRPSSAWLDAPHRPYRPRPLVPGVDGFTPHAPGLSWATIADAHLLIEPGLDGVVYVDPDRAIWESFRFVRPGAADTGLLANNTLQPLDQVAATGHLASATVGFDPGWINYYHWLLQVLPALFHAANDLGAADLVLPDHRAYDERSVRPAFGAEVQRDSLGACLGQAPPLRVLEPGLYRVDELRLLVPVNRREHNLLFDGCLGRRYVDHMRASLGLTESTAEEDARRSLYVTRRGAANAHRTTEDEVARLDGLAADTGFEPLELERLTFSEQARAFSEAGAVLSAHGSGLANIMFAEGLDLFEYVNPVGDEPVARTHFQLLAAQLGHRAMVIDRWSLMRAPERVRSEIQRHADSGRRSPLVDSPIVVERTG